MQQLVGAEPAVLSNRRTGRYCQDREGKYEDHRDPAEAASLEAASLEAASLEAVSLEAVSLEAASPEAVSLEAASSVVA
jgi:uncharacterized protein YjbI with pentapeptide repeats